jgi:hypothetical protein
MTLEHAIVAFFQLYASAFSECDVDKITSLWSFPAYISAEEQAAVYVDAGAFRDNTEKLCDFYKSMGLVVAKKDVLTIEELYSGIVVARTKDELYDSDGKLIAHWEHVYLLRNTDSGWRAITAVADGEMAAWRAKGISLGAS